MSQMLFAYIGPETTLPLMSVVVSVVGAALIFGRSSIQFVKNRARTMLGKKTTSNPQWRRPSNDANP